MEGQDWEAVARLYAQQQLKRAEEAAGGEVEGQRDGVDGNVGAGGRSVGAPATGAQRGETTDAASAIAGNVFFPGKSSSAPGAAACQAGAYGAPSAAGEAGLQCHPTMSLPGEAPHVLKGGRGVPNQCSRSMHSADRSLHVLLNGGVERARRATRGPELKGAPGSTRFGRGSCC